MTEAQWIVMGLLVPLALALWREREKRLKAEWECIKLKTETTAAVDQLHEATRQLVVQSRAPLRRPAPQLPIRHRRRSRPAVPR